jgi:hypothetical protein
MKLELGQTYLDNTGACVRIICVDKAKEPHATCVGLRMESSGVEIVEEYRDDGSYAYPYSDHFYDESFSLRLVKEA